MKTKTLLLASTLLVAALTIAPASADAPERVSYIVGLDVSPSQAPGDNFHGGRVTGVNDAIDFITVETTDQANFLARAEHDPHVRYLTEDSPYAMSASFTPNDPLVGQQWGWDASPGSDAYNAWDVTLGTTGTVVAVLDTGLDKSHEDIGNYLQGYDFSNGDNDPEDGSRCGHGTHVSGTIGALTNNGVGGAGMAQTTILPVKVLEFINPLYGCSGSFATIANGITWAADQGADVISMSLGCAAGCYDQATADAVDYATAQGVLVVVATGNDGGAVGFPASVPNAMAVGAIDQGGNIASFSNTGPEVDIVAPGVSVLSTTGGGYASWDGTSMATPHVSGAAALMLATGSYTNTQLRNTLKSTAVDLGHSANQQGSGALNACAAVGGTGCGSVTPPPPGADKVHTHDIDHWRQGSPTKGNVFIQVWSFNEAEGAESGVTVNIEVSKLGGPTANGGAATGSDGSVTFQWSKIGAGTYTSCVTGMAKAGFTWDSAAGHALSGNCETEAV